MKTYSAQNFGVSPKLFEKWISPRFGNSNPTKMNNKVWEWLIQTENEPYGAYKELRLKNPLLEGPTWTFSRFGKSQTTLDDGRTIYIGGEHEDFYDPDFNIYNDVIVRHADNSIDIYGYPEDTFPPTDFHSATLVNNYILIIGGLGYMNSRKHDITPMYKLNIENFKIEKLNAKGDYPGWIYKHEAVWDAKNESIIISGGTRLDREGKFFENVDQWEFDPKTRIWKRLSENKWPMWTAIRADREPNNIFDLRMAIWESEIKKPNSYEAKKLERDPNRALKLEYLSKLYSPDIPHEKLDKAEENCKIHRIRINGVEIQYTEDMNGIGVIVKGTLPDDTLDFLKQDLIDKLSIIESMECRIEEIGGHVKCH